MQKVRFVNPLGKEVVFDQTPPFIFERITGTGAPDVDMITGEPIGQHKKAFSGIEIRDRLISLWVHIKGSTKREMYENRQKLCTLLNPLLYEDGTLGRFEYTNDFGTKWIPAAVKQGPQQFSRAGRYFTSIPLQFYCPDYLWREMNTVFAALAYLDGGLRFPIRFPIRFGTRGYKENLFSSGDSPSPIMIDITGPAVEPQIVKVRTGEFIKVKRELYVGDKLIVDTTPGARSATIQRAGGDIEKAMGHIDSTSKWFQLDAGDNQLQYLSSDDSQASYVVASTVGRYGGW